MTKRLASKHKVDRRLKANLWGRPKSPFNIRNYAPGQHGKKRSGKDSDYGVQLHAKQRMKFYYGNINERQFRNIYRKAVQKNLVRGRSIEGVAAATLYGACRQCEVPRTLDEITKASNATKKEVGRTYRYISRELGLNLMPASPVAYITRYSRELGLSGKVEDAAIKILQEATESELTSGRGPTGVAAAAIYLASVVYNQRKTQKVIADTVGVTEVTIRNRYKELTEYLSITAAIAA